MQKLTQKDVQFLFNYKDGHLYWLVRPSNSVQIGDMAGSLSKNEYYRIKINSKRKSLGLFDLEIKAAQTYNKAAIKYFGEYAYLNEV